MSAMLRRALSWLAIAASLALAGVAHAQLGGGAAVPTPAKLVRVSATPVEIKAGGEAQAVFTLAIERGWHVNANPPSPDYMIPTVLEIAPDFGITPGKTLYPPPQSLKVGFEETPLAVMDGEAKLTVPLLAAGGAINGRHALRGSLRFQSCNDQVCLAPATIPVELVVTVTGGAPDRGGKRSGPLKGNAPAELEGGKPASGGQPTGVTAPPEASHAPPPEVNPTPKLTETPAPPPPAPTQPSDTSGTAIAPVAPLTPPPATSVGWLAGVTGALQRIDAWILAEVRRGGPLAFLALFIAGLLLNLTPCVYPMLGVTVSIFGARQAGTQRQAIGYAMVYVLGITIMYSALGGVAGLTGGLFGGALSNRWVTVAIGLLLIGLSLSMFGLYEIQMPAALLNRLGGSGTTSLAGVFGSGLVVGIFAAPCVGPVVIALLAAVAAKGDPLFGFTSFFTLGLGLGAPYLVLATYSSLIQKLPRSGEWMIWVKRVFGAILLALGLFYALLTFVPGWAMWVAPAALVIGGIVLGFIDRNADARPAFFWFKRLAGGAALLAGVFMIATAPREAIAFDAFTPEALSQARASRTPVMLDFTASWCAECHELERLIFTDSRVRSAAKGFRTLRVDLTGYDTPESQRWVHDYKIGGLPTVLFLGPDGGEVRNTRVVGMIPPQEFLARMRMAAGEGQRAAGE